MQSRASLAMSFKNSKSLNEDLDIDNQLKEIDSKIQVHMIRA
jgi:hypothetical protein